MTTQLRYEVRTPDDTVLAAFADHRHALYYKYGHQSRNALTVHTLPSPPAPSAGAEAGFTPGPWSIEPNERPEFPIRVVDAVGSRVAQCSHASWFIGVEQARINAHLIAAAPDLYDLALRVGHMPDAYTASGLAALRAAARSLVLKATGKLKTPGVRNMNRPEPTKAELDAMSESDAIEATEGMAEHPEGYDGPCACNLCFSYDGEPDEDAGQ